MFSSECSGSRLVKPEKTEFTYVIECFSGKHNAEIGHYGQTLIKNQLVEVKNPPFAASANFAIT